jgi:sirohydrochlorin ferrochelatase
MTAPALVTLACGPVDPRAARAVREIVATTRGMRPDLRIDAAFTAGARPNLERVVAGVAARGHDEVVVVPLLVACTEQAELDVRSAVDEASHSHPATRVRASDLIGADASLLTVLDERMRTALRIARVRELDAVVLAAAGSSDARVTASIARLARLWSVHHHLPTSIAFANTSPPSTGEAVREWRRQGKRHVAVGSLFITAGPHAARAAELAVEAGACAVSAPLGAHEALSRLIVARYSVGALELVPV